MSGPAIPPLDSAIAALAATASHQVASSADAGHDLEHSAQLDRIDLYAVRLNATGALEMGHVSHSSHSSHSSGASHFSGHASHASHTSHASHYSGSVTHHSGAQPLAPQHSRTTAPQHSANPSQSATPSPTPSVSPSPSPASPTPSSTLVATPSPTPSPALGLADANHKKHTNDDSGTWAWLISIGWIGLLVLAYRRWRATRRAPKL